MIVEFIINRHKKRSPCSDKKLFLQYLGKNCLAPQVKDSANITIGSDEKKKILPTCDKTRKCSLAILYTKHLLSQLFRWRVRGEHTDITRLQTRPDLRLQ